MMLSTQCPLCGDQLIALGKSSRMLQLAHEQQVQDHAVQHARDGDAGAMTKLLQLEPDARLWWADRKSRRRGRRTRP